MGEEFVPDIYNTLVVILKPASAALCPQDSEFSSFPLETLNSALSRMIRECGGFRVRRAAHGHKFIVTFQKTCVAELVLLVDRLRFNEHVQYTRIWDYRDDLEKMLGKIVPGRQRG